MCAVCAALTVVVLHASAASAGVGGTDAGEPGLREHGGSATVKVELAGADEDVEVVRIGEGEYRFVLHTAEGARELTPHAFAERVYQEQASRSWVLVLLNATSSSAFLWVGLGLLGQLLFTGRMLVQWVASERHRRSVVPTAFWWMSLIGATMLLVYFIWRKDIVGVIGQSTGWLIYGRNLLLIYQTAEPLLVVTDEIDKIPELTDHMQCNRQH